MNSGSNSHNGIATSTTVPGIGGDQPGLQFDEHLAEVGAENIWLAESNGEIVGMTGLIVREGEGELEAIIVSPGHRAKGIGRRLAEAVIKGAREKGLRRVIVKPVGRNASAIQFFHAMGFDILGAS